MLKDHSCYAELKCQFDLTKTKAYDALKKVHPVELPHLTTTDFVPSTGLIIDATLKFIYISEIKDTIPSLTVGNDVLGAVQSSEILERVLFQCISDYSKLDSTKSKDDKSNFRTQMDKKRYPFFNKSDRSSRWHSTLFNSGPGALNRVLYETIEKEKQDIENKMLKEAQYKYTDALYIRIDEAKNKYLESFVHSSQLDKLQKEALGVHTIACWHNTWMKTPKDKDAFDTSSIPTSFNP